MKKSTETAYGIVRDLGSALAASHTGELAAAITAALDAMLPPPGHVLTDGVVRRVLGTLPLTKDGVVMGSGDYDLFKWGWATFGDVDEWSVITCDGMEEDDTDVYSSLSEAAAAESSSPSTPKGAERGE